MFWIGVFIEDDGNVVNDKGGPDIRSVEAPDRDTAFKISSPHIWRIMVRMKTSRE